MPSLPPQSRRLAWPALALALLVGSGLRAQQGAPSYPGGVVAVVEGEPITRRELELSSRLRPDYQGVTAGSKEQAKVYLAEAEELIKTRLLVQRAQSEKVAFDEKQDAKRLAWELQRQARRFGGRERMLKALAQLRVPYAYFVNRQKAQISISKLLVKTISRDIFVSPRQIRLHYKANLGKYRRPGEIRLRQLVIYPDPKEALRLPPAVQAEVQKGWKPKAYAQALRKRLVGGASFAQIASDCSMGAKWKDEWVITSTRMEETFADPVLGERIRALKPGELSEVVESEEGSLYVILLVDRRAPGVLPLSEVQREIESGLKDAVWQRRLQAWLKEVRKQAKVKVYLPKAR